MKIATPFENGMIFQHFGKSPAFKVYTTDENNDITNFEVVSTNGQGHSALADILSQLNIDVLICGGIGAGAVNALTDKGIEVYGGNVGNPDSVVIKFLAGTLEQKAVTCNHHHEGGKEHTCGEHGCH